MVTEEILSRTEYSIIFNRGIALVPETLSFPDSSVVASLKDDRSTHLYCYFPLQSAGDRVCCHTRTEPVAFSWLEQMPQFVEGTIPTGFHIQDKCTWWSSHFLIPAGISRSLYLLV